MQANLSIFLDVHEQPECIYHQDAESGNKWLNVTMPRNTKYHSKGAVTLTIHGEQEDIFKFLANISHAITIDQEKADDNA